MLLGEGVCLAERALEAGVPGIEEADEAAPEEGQAHLTRHTLPVGYHGTPPDPLWKCRAWKFYGNCARPTGSALARSSERRFDSRRFHAEKPATFNALSL